MQTAFLGDVVLTTPLLRALAARHGPVDVVTTPAAAPLLDTHPAVRQVIRYDKRGADRGWSGFAALARRLREAHYEVAYVPHRSLRSALLVWWARVPRRVGFRDGWRSLYSESRKRPTSGHEVDRLLALAGDPQAIRTPSIGLTPADHGAAAAFLESEGLGNDVVALAPGSIWGTKRWPHFAALAGRLAPSHTIAVVGGGGDQPLAGAIVAAVRNAGGKAASGCGSLTLRESAALLSRCRLLVTNDSAPLHFAQAVGTPTVAIFGPTLSSFGFGPLYPVDRVVEVADLACRPCSKHGPAECPLGHHRCMWDLSVERVIAAIEETGALRRRD
ncbi:MAG TPA: lipopolysaccharide heptosyltransferase II [Gemmatimonadales bacterium]|nr:lipopolysaccharide heptosyltransferase II [Gemmatimonadales bacterium]